MLSICGYLKGFDEEVVDTQNRIAVNCCGHYRLLNRSEYETLRPAGRQDFQLLYLAGGSARFSVEGEMITADADTFILYYPGELQQYHYNIQEDPDIYWVHFSGTGVMDFLKELEIDGQHLFKVKNGKKCIPIFDQIIRELQLKRKNFFALTNIYLEELMLMLSRMTEDESPDTNRRNQMVEKAIEYFHQEYGKELSVQDYADENNVSCCWFIRSFKQHTGITPGQYITNLRINKAKELLQDGTLNISETAAFVGYENPLYFSRIFKKNTGMSPREYIKSQPGMVYIDAN